MNAPPPSPLLRPLSPHRCGGGQPVRWLPSDLGQPIPEDPHAISVCLPTWDSVIAYEENDPLVRGSLRAGYPRFVLPPAVRELHDRVGGGKAYAFGSAGAARRALSFVQAGGGVARIEQAGSAALLCFGDDAVAKDRAWQVWRHAGEGLSSRSSEAVLRGESHATSSGDAARAEVREILARWHGVTVADVHLFPSGMAAVSTLHQYLSSRDEGGEGTVQVDFPYVDVARVQKHFGKANFLSITGSEATAGGLAAAFASGLTTGVFCEIPANPLLDCVNLPAVAAIAAKQGVPVVADDTVASVANVALLPHADFVTTSLSKWSTGSCNVLAGAVIVRPGSRFGGGFGAWVLENDAAPLGDLDAAVVAGALPSLAARMVEVNRNAAAVADILRQHPGVRSFWYPRLDEGHPYAMVARPGAGAGGLMSFALRGGERAAAAFYDHLALDKGPSLGADFSMACPYTLLAHYDELDHAEAWGVPRDLIRLSVGTEPVDWSLSALDRAFEAAAR
ncbi:MAG: PLP-dependent transferase [Verrucomicrobiales bacterium]